MRQHNLVLLGILLVIISVVVTSQPSRVVADAHYDEAVELYENGECLNASTHANRAYEIYSELNNEEGISKCAELIKDINECLKNRARMYYLQALQYLDSNDCENAKTFAYRARELYSAIPSEEDVSKCDELISRADECLTDKKRREANENYDKASEFYFSKDYLNALNYTRTALAIFSEINDTGGIMKCNALLNRIETDMLQVKEKANIDYRKAEEFCNSTEYEKALEYAQSASDGYLMIGDEEGFSNAKKLIELIQRRTGEYEKEQRELADSYYEKAKIDFLARDYASAIANADMARDIYTELRSRAETKEDIEVYDELIGKCDELLERIRTEQNRIGTKEQADSDYAEAWKLYYSAKYENASETAQRAKELYQSIGDFVGVSNCNSLLDDINARLNLKYQAEDYYNKSIGLYSSADYENATIYIEKARGIYSDIGLFDRVELCNSTIEKIEEGKADKKEANDYYKKAQGYYNLRNYESALRNAERAKEIYLRINYSAGIEDATTIILDSESEIHKAGRIQEMYRNIITVVIVLVVILIAVRWWLEKRKKIEIMKRTEEEKAVKKELEEKLEREKKKREEEEGRKRLEEERERLKSILEKEKKILDNMKKEKK